jgi:hypothetical protein
MLKQQARARRRFNPEIIALYAASKAGIDNLRTVSHVGATTK